MEIWLILRHLVFGMFLGSIIGLDREKSAEGKYSKFAGIRTFTLIGLLGVLLGLLESISLPLFFGILSGYLLLVIASYVVYGFHFKQTGGISAISSFLVIIAGYFVGNDNYVMGSIITISAAIMLYGKEKIRNIISKITKEEMASFIQFTTILFVILPLLPNEYYGPLGAWNPYIIWLMIVLISGISFLSYIAIRVIGTNKGLSLSGFLGGLIASTAVALTFSKKSKEQKKVVAPFVFGIVIAGTAMFFRVLMVVLLANDDLIRFVGVPLMMSGGVGLLLSLWFWRVQKQEEEARKSFWFKQKGVQLGETVDLGKPVDLKAAIKFGGVFALIVLVAKFMQLQFGNEGVYLTAILSGLVDTNAITVSLATLARDGSLPENLAGAGIILASLSGIAMKGILVLIFASKKVIKQVVMSVGLMILVGGVSAYFF